MAEGFFANFSQVVTNFLEGEDDSDNTIVDISASSDEESDQFFTPAVIRTSKASTNQANKLCEDTSSSDTEGDHFFTPSVVQTPSVSAHFRGNLRRSLSTGNLLNNGVSSSNNNVDGSNAVRAQIWSTLSEEHINYGLSPSSYSTSTAGVTTQKTPNQNFKIKDNPHKELKSSLNIQPILPKTVLFKCVTLPKPFSFEERDRQLKKKKEDCIKKILQEQKKVREFRAKPAPKKILNCRTRGVDNIKQTSTTSKEFHFKTEDRIHARHKFEEILKKEAKLADIKRQNEEMLKKKKGRGDILVKATDGTESPTDKEI